MSATPSARLPALRPTRGRRYSLRSLLALVLLVGVGLCLWDTHVEGYRRQRRMASQIEGLGGSIYTEPVEADWRRLLFPGESFVKVVFVGLSYAPIDDAWLGCLLHLPHVRKLFLDRTPIGDAGLAHLPGLQELQMLGLTGTKVTDAGLASLQSLPSLYHLWLDGAAVTDAGLAHLEGLGQLRLLALRGCNITDAGLVHLLNLREMQVLDLRDTRVTDAGIAQLVALQNIRTLLLDNTHVTDASLPHFRKLPALRELSLAGTQIMPTSMHLAFAINFRVSSSRFALKRGERLTRELSAALHGPMTAKFDRRPLRVVFDHLTQQHGIPIVPDPALRVDTLVSLDDRGMPVGLALERLFMDHDLHGVVENNSIRVAPGPAPSVAHGGQVQFTRCAAINASSTSTKPAGVNENAA